MVERVTGWSFSKPVFGIAVECPHCSGRMVVIDEPRHDPFCLDCGSREVSDEYLQAQRERLEQLAHPAPPSGPSPWEEALARYQRERACIDWLIKRYDAEFGRMRVAKPDEIARYERVHGPASQRLKEREDLAARSLRLDAAIKMMTEPREAEPGTE